MEQIGIVKEVYGNTATVLVHRTSACGENCAHCKGGCTSTDMKAQAENCIGAGVGDMVKMESDTGKVIFAAVMLYFVPLLAGIVSAIIVASITPRMAPLLIISVNVFLGAILLVKSFDKKIAPTPKVTKIIRKKQA